MSATACPACHEPLGDTTPPAVFCPACGHNLADAPPRQGWVIGEIDLRTVARRQRMLLWYVLAALLMQIVMPVLAAAAPPPLALLAFAVSVGVLILIIVGVVQMLAALRVHILLRVLFILLLFAPCINMLMLLIANRMATGALRKAGLRVGLMGVSDETVVRFLGLYRCRKCGYSLIGNTSGRCPECGTPVGEAVPPADPGATAEIE